MFPLSEHEDTHCWDCDAPLRLAQENLCDACLAKSEQAAAGEVQ